MKFKAVFAVLLSVLMLTSCGSSSKLVNSTDFSNGSIAGSVLSKFFTEYSNTGSIDFSKAQNILNVSSLVSALTSLKGDLSNQTTKDYSSGLISGSSNLVNNGNVSGVLSALTSLGNFDFTKATNDMQRGRASTSGNVADLTSGIVNILSLLKK